MSSVLDKPSWMSSAAHYAAVRGWVRAQLELDRLKAPPAARRLFAEVFERRHQFKRMPEGTRAELAEQLGRCVKTITRSCAWLRRNGFVFEGNDASGRKLGVVMLRQEWLVAAVFHNDDDPRRVVHRPSTIEATGTEMSHSMLYRTPLSLRSCGDVPDSDPKRLEPSALTANGDDNGCHEPTNAEIDARNAQLRRRHVTGPKGALWSSAQLTRELLGRLRPEGSGPVERWNSGHEIGPPEAPS